jgi:hypothetical protein
MVRHRPLTVVLLLALISVGCGGGGSGSPGGGGSGQSGGRSVTSGATTSEGPGGSGVQGLSGTRSGPGESSAGDGSSTTDAHHGGSSTSGTRRPSPLSSTSSQSPVTVFAQDPATQQTGIRCPRWYVLPPGRTAFDDGDLKQMAAVLETTAHSDPGTAPAAVPASPLLLVPGALINVHSDPDSTAPYAQYPLCRMWMQITNTSQSVIQIPQVGFRLTQAPARNISGYPLVDSCSVQGVATYCGVQKGGGAAACDFYSAEVNLGGGGPDAAFFGTPRATAADGSPCPQITLQPNESVEIRLDPLSVDAFVYPVTPLVVVATRTGSMTVPLPQYAGSISFAAASQFSCLRLQGHSFVAAWSGADALNWRGRAQDAAYCI